MKSKQPNQCLWIRDHPTLDKRVPQIRLQNWKQFLKPYPFPIRLTRFMKTINALPIFTSKLLSRPPLRFPPLPLHVPRKFKMTYLRYMPTLPAATRRNPLPPFLMLPLHLSSSLVPLPQCRERRGDQRLVRDRSQGHVHYLPPSPPRP
jgi:hypothetical protein